MATVLLTISTPFLGSDERRHQSHGHRQLIGCECFTSSSPGRIFFFRSRHQEQRRSRKATRRGRKRSTGKDKDIETAEEATEDLIFNISTQQLSDAEMSLLRKGLGFVPVVSNTRFSTVIDNYKFTRQIQLKEYYGAGGGVNKSGTDVATCDNVLERTFKNKSDFDPGLQACIYTKPTDRNTLLHYKSHHPKHILDSLPKSQMLRVVRIDSELSDRIQDLQIMKKKFITRGYPKQLVQDVMNWAMEVDRDEVLTQQDRVDEGQKKWAATGVSASPVANAARIADLWFAIRSRNDVIVLPMYNKPQGHLIKYMMYLEVQPSNKIVCLHLFSFLVVIIIIIIIIIVVISQGLDLSTEQLLYCLMSSSNKLLSQVNYTHTHKCAYIKINIPTIINYIAIGYVHLNLSHTGKLPIPLEHMGVAQYNVQKYKLLLTL
uniref:Helix-turn-helix domain-containing protein n=1 Tax=Xenopus tropicalis TaxID=8364 RepID=A0A1B8Y2P3_XENTR